MQPLRSCGHTCWQTPLNFAWAWFVQGRGFELLNILVRPQYTLWFLLALVWWRVLLPVFALGECTPAAVSASLARARRCDLLPATSSPTVVG